MREKNFKIFLDFDGTITQNDVGEEIFRKFLDEHVVEKIVKNLVADKITSRECWEQLCESVINISESELDEFILSQHVDRTLHKFINFCDSNKFDVLVLSDGFDYYIDRILRKENLSHLKYYSNKLSISAEGRLIPSFPFYDADCRGSANCKRKHIIENSGEDDYTVYIGDGTSDFDAIQYVDFIFAKDSLLRFCEVNRITFFPFKDFNDVISKLDEMLAKKRLKKRHQAQLKLREAYKIE